MTDEEISFTETSFSKIAFFDEDDNELMELTSSFDWRHKCTRRKSFKVAVKAQKQLTKVKEILRKFLDAKSIEETCVTENETYKFLSEV